MSFMISIIAYELRILARLMIRRFRPYVIGVTGSSGKTTVKYMIGELIRSQTSDVFVSSGNMNTETGVPLSVLRYQDAPENPLSWAKILLTAPLRTIFTFSYPKYLVLEYAADKPKDIEYLLKIAEPDIAVITNFGVAHLEAFKSPEKIAQEKWKLVVAARQKIVCPRSVRDKGLEIEYPRADILIPFHKSVTISAVKALTNKTEFTLEIYGTRKKTGFEFFGEHNVENLEIAILAALSAGVAKKRIFSAVETLKPQPGRGQRVDASRDILILDESYNANPVSMLAALKNFSSINPGRKVAVLGEMKEIGSISVRSHLEVAKFAKRISNLTVGVGAGFRDTNLDKWYPNVEELIKETGDIFVRGDLVLVKGSHSNKLEKLVEELSK